ncbi:MAG: hypothetical protein ABL891_18725 [Burkholderiales bacterium]
MEVVSLDWRRFPIEEDGFLPKDLPKSSGVYAFQGCHDSCPSFGVLYIGRAQVLADRVRDSLCERIFWKNGARYELYSDVWHATLHYAELEFKQLKRVEDALIASHAPAFNNTGTRGAMLSNIDDLRNLLVLNCGRKGALLPTVFGGYYVDELWP